MKEHWGFAVSEKTIWYVGLVITGIAVLVSFTIPDPADIYVPGADENLSISNGEIARRIRLSPDLKGKPEHEIAAAVEEALAAQRRAKATDPDADSKMADYRRAGASETTMLRSLLPLAWLRRPDALANAARLWRLPAPQLVGAVQAQVCITSCNHL